MYIYIYIHNEQTRRTTTTTTTRINSPAAFHAQRSKHPKRGGRIPNGYHPLNVERCRED